MVRHKRNEHPVRESWRRALIDAGYTFESKKDRWGKTKNGWWRGNEFLGETVDDAYRTLEADDKHRGTCGQSPWNSETG